MFGWVPILGPIIDGVVSIWTGSQNEKVQLGAQDVEVVQARAQVAIAFKDDIGVRLCRDLIMFPVAVWVALIAWYNCFHHLWPSKVWIIDAFPTNLEYIPYAIIAFLFVTAFRK